MKRVILILAGSTTAAGIAFAGVAGPQIRAQSASGKKPEHMSVRKQSQARGATEVPSRYAGLSRLIGRHVKVRLRDGSLLQGRLVRISASHVFIDENGKVVVRVRLADLARVTAIKELDPRYIQQQNLKRRKRARKLLKSHLPRFRRITAAGVLFFVSGGAVTAAGIALFVSVANGFWQGTAYNGDWLGCILGGITLAVGLVGTIGGSLLLAKAVRSWRVLRELQIQLSAQAATDPTHERRLHASLSQGHKHASVFNWQLSF